MIPIPIYPKFRLLEIGDRQMIEVFTRRFLHYSDYSFTSLWCWVKGCAISRLHGNLVVRFLDYETGEPFYSFLGDEAVLETALTLLARARAEGLPECLKLIPEPVVMADTRLSRLLSVTADRDNFDYVYAADDWSRFAGTAFATHRQMITRCRRETSLDFRPLDLRDADVQTGVIRLFRDWAGQKSTADGVDHTKELAALQRLFSLSDDDRIWACGFLDGNRIVGFAISEGLPGGEWVIAHFKKTDLNYRGLSSRICQEESRLLLARSYRSINFEQDLGIPGLRQHKESLRPRRLLEKFMITVGPITGT